MKKNLGPGMFFCLLVSVTIYSCQKTLDPSTLQINPHANEISSLIDSLAYSPDEMMNVQSTGGTASSRDLIKEDKASNYSKGQIISCVSKTYNLKANFDEVAILRPTNGIIWPGALVIANQSMLDGLPDPLTLERGPVSLRVDLPGIGQNGNLTVNNPTNSSVQAAIDGALEWWNGNAYQDGYVNAANSSYQATTSYSAKQVSIDVGLNVEWATGDVASQFNYSNSTSSRVAMMVFKQVFYTVSMDPPTTPVSVFAPSVSLDQVKNAIGSTAPPAYVQSVAYGRIIMFRMETTEEATDAELTGAFNYASGLSNASGDIETKYKSILKKSSITTVTIGGNAAVASEAVSAQSFGDLRPIITGKNAVYSRENPGVPIAYVVRYLKDNSFAKMGYTTEYTANTCSTSLSPNESIKFTNKDWGWARIRIVYKKPGASNDTYTDWIEDIAEDETKSIQPEAGAYDIRFQEEFKYVGCILGTCYKDQEQLSFGTIPARVCVITEYDWSKLAIKIKTTGNCN